MAVGTSEIAAAATASSPDHRCGPQLSSLADRRCIRPLPLRTRTELDACSSRDPFTSMHHNGASHARHKSTLVSSGGPSRTASGRRSSHAPRVPGSPPVAVAVEQSSTNGPATSELPKIAGPVPTPPTSPLVPRVSGDSGDCLPDVRVYDFSKVDYELARARILGTGLWSKVVLADAAVPSPTTSSTLPGPNTLPTPPVTPQRKPPTMLPSVYAVKLPARKDAIPVFEQEARILTHVVRQSGATQHIVPFFGQDPRNGALVFEAVIGGSLDNLNSRLKQMTELARHLELVSIFPGIAADLICGLEFLHGHGVVHADLKPANILLDISEHPSLPHAEIRARYIDFSASFRPAHSADTTTHAGGTWDFMAPEQMRLQPELNTPTRASDVWSLGVTLLSVIVGQSPYAAACGANTFMLREAIKSGDPLGFARMEPVIRKRLTAAQDFVDCVRLALHKDRERRASAEAWRVWVEQSEFGVVEA